jgi:hypothetical protein
VILNQISRSGLVFPEAGLSHEKNGSPGTTKENCVSSTLYVVDTIEFLAKPRFKDKVFLHQKYVVERLSTEQIADLCFSSRPTISKHLRLHKIPIRKHEERLLLNKGQLALGERRGHRGIQQNKSEGEIIKTIIDLRAKGYSYRQVAAWLDAKGTKTKNNRGLWRAATVM